MIKYDPLWDTSKKRGISQYSLIKDYGIDKAQLQRLRSNMVVKTMILNRLCDPGLPDRGHHGICAGCKRNRTKTVRGIRKKV